MCVKVLVCYCKSVYLLRNFGYKVYKLMKLIIMKNGNIYSNLEQIIFGFYGVNDKMYQLSSGSS